MAGASLVAAVGRRLEGKVALITGGSRGIGESTAKLLAKHGAKVVIADIEDELGHSVVENIGHSNSSYIHCDVTNEDDIKRALNKTVSSYGKLDIMFNNAGILDNTKALIMDYEKHEFELVMKVNITGVFLGMKHAARVMVPAHSGSIISMASTASRIGGVATHAYACSKHAIDGLTKNLAVELGQFGIRVNCLSPSAVATHMATNFTGLDGETIENIMSSCGNLKGATLKVEDVANAALFLASDEAKYVSGLNLVIDGGVTIVNSAIKILNNQES